MRLWRAKYKEKAAYANLRGSAKRRKIEFNLTFDEFVELVVDTKYISLKGRDAGDLQIDRKDSTKGYVKGNLRVITCTENVIRGNKARRLPPNPTLPEWVGGEEEEEDPF